VWSLLAVPHGLIYFALVLLADLPIVALAQQIATPAPPNVSS
jgi:hypothetical protein